MQQIDLTLPTPEQNLAFDEALLDLCEEGYPHEILRFWEFSHYFVVTGYSNKISREVNVPYCQAAGIPILRRTSGGGTVLQGPGCLNYALILDIRRNAALENITRTNAFIMEKNASALSKASGRTFEVKGHTDLAENAVKFSGNAQRRKRQCLLFHGTFLIDFDMSLIEKTLAMPSLQPSYRNNRKHLDFVRNSGLARKALKEALRETWGAQELFTDIPQEKIDRLVQDQYGNPAWVEKF